MKLILNDYTGVYVWVDDTNKDTVLSPQFDCEEDAIQWYGRMSTEIFDEYGIAKESNK